MEQQTKPSPWMIALHVALSLATLGGGLYALIEKKLIISGKYSGDLYELSTIESILIAVSFFLVSAFLVMILSEKRLIKITSEWFLGIAVVVFLSSTFF